MLHGDRSRYNQSSTDTSSNYTESFSNLQLSSNDYTGHNQYTDESHNLATTANTNTVPIHRITKPMFISNELYTQLHNNNIELLQRTLPDDPLFNTELPVQLNNSSTNDMYVNLYSIDTTNATNAANMSYTQKQQYRQQLKQYSTQTHSVKFPYTTKLIKCNSVNDGYTYCIRRIQGATNISLEYIHKCMKQWHTILYQYNQQQQYLHGTDDSSDTLYHPCFVTVRDAFLSNEFLDTSSQSICYVYDYITGSHTLYEYYFNTASQHYAAQMINESVIWLYITQLISAIQLCHTNQMPLTGLSTLDRILVSHNHRLHINCMSMYESMRLIDIPHGGHVKQYYNNDLYQLGLLLLQLCTLSSNVTQPLLSHNSAPLSTALLNKSIDIMKQSKYSNELISLIVLLCTKTNDHRYSPDIHQIQQICSTHIVQSSTHVISLNDSLYTQLNIEYTNGRLFRLLSKLCYLVNTELIDNPLRTNVVNQGDVYLLQLLYSYMFHQLNASNTANLDYGHIVSVLNKLDIGSDENILLTSVNGDTILIVKYSDLKQCIDNNFSLLQQYNNTQQQSGAVYPSDVYANEVYDGNAQPYY